MREFFDTVGTATRPSRRDGEAIAQPSAGGLQGEGILSGPRRSWAENDGTFWGTPKSHDRLPSGLYRMDVYPNLGPVFLRQKNDTDTLIELPDSESANLVDEIKTFKGLREKFKSHGFLYKRGILMWGPPGSGKTCTLQLLAKLLMDEHDSVAVLVDRPNVAADCLQALRHVEPDRQVVAILEDMDALCERYGESEYLALLDGESQVDNIVYVATTNYPERLDRRFVDRPSRFDTIRYIGMPTAEARKTYFEAKAPEITGQTLAEFVSFSNGYSIAHLRELIILTQCFGVSMPDACERLNKTRRQSPSSDKAPDRAALGFA